MKFTELNPRGGEPLVVLTGYMFGAWTFAPMLTELQSLRIIVVEDIGTPDRDHGGGSFRTAIDRIECNLAARGLGPVHLAGHSMGGFIAQEYASLHPGRMKSLTLLGSCHLDEFKDSHRVNALPALDALFDLDEDTFFRFSVNNIFSPDFLGRPDQAARLRRDFDLCRPDRERCRAQLHMLEDLYASGGCYDPPKVPCLAVYGEEDSIVPADWVRRLDQYLQPRPRYRPIPSSHMFMYERPTETAAVLQDWVRQFK